MAKATGLGRTIIQQIWRALERAQAVLAVAVMAWVRRLALANHRSADRDPARIAIHIGGVAAAITWAIGLAAVAGVLSR